MFDVPDPGDTDHTVNRRSLNQSRLTCLSQWIRATRPTTATPPYSLIATVEDTVAAVLISLVVTPPLTLTIVPSRGDTDMKHPDPVLPLQPLMPRLPIFDPINSENKKTPRQVLIRTLPLIYRTDLTRRDGCCPSEAMTRWRIDSRIC